MPCMSRHGILDMPRWWLPSAVSLQTTEINSLSSISFCLCVYSNKSIEQNYYVLLTITNLDVVSILWLPFHWLFFLFLLHLLLHWREIVRWYAGAGTGTSINVRAKLITRTQIIDAFRPAIFWCTMIFALAGTLRRLLAKLF